MPGVNATRCACDQVSPAVEGFPDLAAPPNPHRGVAAPHELAAVLSHLSPIVSNLNSTSGRRLALHTYLLTYVRTYILTQGVDLLCILTHSLTYLLTYLLTYSGRRLALHGRARIHRAPPRCRQRPRGGDTLPAADRRGATALRNVDRRWRCGFQLARQRSRVRPEGERHAGRLCGRWRDPGQPCEASTPTIADQAVQMTWLGPGYSGCMFGYDGRPHIAH